MSFGDDFKVRDERSSWRDEALSKRHREWGFNIPAVDLDFLMLEYDQGRAVSLVEYKHEFAQPQNPNHPSFRAMVDLGDRAQIAVFAVRYGLNLDWFLVVPLNYIAKQFVETRTRMAELEYVSLLYRLRHREIPQNIIDALATNREAKRAS